MKVLCFLILAAVSQAATFTPIQTNPAEPHPETILDGIFGAGAYYRVSDDIDQIIPGDSIVSVDVLASYAASTNVFVSLPTLGGFIGCIQTSLSFTEDHCTDPALNPDGRDYVATWRLFSDPEIFLLGFEDWPLPRSDYNFNDLVVKVRVGHRDIPPSEVPEGGTLWYALLGLAVLGVRRLSR